MRCQFSDLYAVFKTITDIDPEFHIQTPKPYIIFVAVVLYFERKFDKL